MKKSLRIKTIWVCFAFMFIFIGGMMGYALLRVQCLNMGYEISRNTTFNRRLAALRNNFKIELEHLQSLERIEKIARKELGLNAPSHRRIIGEP